MNVFLYLMFASNLVFAADPVVVFSCTVELEEGEEVAFARLLSEDYELEVLETDGTHQLKVSSETAQGKEVLYSKPATLEKKSDRFVVTGKGLVVNLRPMEDNQYKGFVRGKIQGKTVNETFICESGKL